MLGANDGIVSTASLVVGVAAAWASQHSSCQAVPPVNADMAVVVKTIDTLK